jgi:hypothetical protein
LLGLLLFGVLVLEYPCWNTACLCDYWHWRSGLLVLESPMSGKLLFKQALLDDCAGLLDAERM